MSLHDVIIRNLEELKQLWEENAEEIEDDDWVPTEGEYGDDLTWQIDCHPIFKGDPPCLLDERHIEMDKKGLYKKHCRECISRWLMREYDD